MKIWVSFPLSRNDLLWFQELSTDVTRAILSGIQSQIQQRDEEMAWLDSCCLQLKKRDELLTFQMESPAAKQDWITGKCCQPNVCRTSQCCHLNHMSCLKCWQPNRCVTLHLKASMNVNRLIIWFVVSVSSQYCQLNMLLTCLQNYGWHSWH